MVYYSSLPDMFFSRAEKMQEKTAIMRKVNGSWESISYSKIKEYIEEFACGLASLGIKSGDKVAIISENRMEWAITDFAVLSLGAVLVPLYPILPTMQIKYILENSESKVIIASNRSNYEKSLECFDQLDSLNKIITFYDEPKLPNEKGMTFWKLIERGKEFMAMDRKFVKKNVRNLTRENLASIIYTSGTTGVPKGALLTHNNFLSNVESGLSIIEVFESDVFLSFLPLCHVFERTGGHFVPFYSGATIAYAESIDTVADNLQEIKPTIMVSVPRLYEKVYAKILDGVEKGSGLQKKIFFWSINKGKKHLYNKIEGKFSAISGLQNSIANALVFKKLQERVGGNVRFFISGGAPLSKEIAEFFASASLLILEGYGLTETSPVITLNSLSEYKFGTVGKPVPGVEVKIAEDGEILARGPNVMKGYFKNSEATAAAIDRDEWFHTGDIGEFDENGFVKITDRKKNLIVTSGGKNIAPQLIENLLLSSQYIDQVLILGDRRKFIMALIVPNYEKVTEFAQNEKIEYKEIRELVENETVNKMFYDEIENLSHGLARFERVKKFVLLEEGFTVENGGLTPTLKVKRGIVERRYKDLINQLYGD